jgi:predicted RND superfamily exporter protein/outer membrane lipoprotein-sorting protein
MVHERFIGFSMKDPRAVMAAVAILMVAAAAMIPRIKVDTDPENMLPPDQAARVFHNQVKKDFTLWDMMVVGVVNEKHPDGIYNPATLTRVHDLTQAIQKIDGVIRQDLMSLSSVDNIAQDGPGVVRFEWMIAHPPKTAAEAHKIRASVKRLPTIEGTIVSEDGRAVGIYIPIVDKNEGHRIATEIEDIIAGYEGDEQYFITGLPVAEDTFGVEMFRQMGISAPLAGLIIFLLMWFFFRSLALVISPMIVAIATVTITMGLLIGTGFTVHIMSSMIPIFLMPIAVVDSVHILSEFADLYPKYRDKRKTISVVMEDLFRPMLYTSLTSAAGFASLAFAPIPPVRVFGSFVAVGIAVAFLLTIVFIPAYVVRLSDARIAKLKKEGGHAHDNHLLARMLRGLGPRTLAGSKLIVAATLVILVVSVVGISRIQINDNPVRWFRPDHRIRVADRVLNKHFGGTYNAFLVLDKAEDANERRALDEEVAAVLAHARQNTGVDLSAQWKELNDLVAEAPLSRHIDALVEGATWKIEEAEERGDGDEAYAWEDILAVLEDAQVANKYFQRPEALQYVASLQAALMESDLVGKTTALPDIVKTVHRELREGEEKYYSIPGSSYAVAQTLLSYQSSHRPQDLWHFMTPDFRKTMIWLQLKSGDNKDMAAVERHVERFVAENPPPDGVTMDWAGLTYLNVVWQDKMVAGMLNALLGSFVIVFFMMLILFRSFWFALLSMLPLSVTIAFIYGLIGLAGKDYDMPVAVLSSLTLGLSVDFAIHFLQRSRDVFRETGNWRGTIDVMFNEPARAISRNAIVIAIGFLPLLASPLVPYNTVGFFLAMIMTVSCGVTLILLPAVMNLFVGRLFGKGSVEDSGATKDKNNKEGNAMKQTVTAALVGVMALGIFGAPASAADLTDVNEIIVKANNTAYYAGDDGRAQVRMTITDAQGRERIRQFAILRKDKVDGGDQSYAVLFVRPADVRNTVFLVEKHVDGDDDRWLYLPGLDLVKRIAAGDKRTSFVGSHFFYEDVSGRAIDEDNHELVKTTDKYYIVESKPKDPGSVEFVSWTAWIDKKTLIPVRMEYVDDKGEVYRKIEALEVRDFEGHPTVTQMKVTDERTGGSTLSEFRNVEYDIGIPDEVFTERTLRNPSREWFKGKTQ